MYVGVSIAGIVAAVQCAWWPGGCSAVPSRPVVTRVASTQQTPSAATGHKSHASSDHSHSDDDVTSCCAVTRVTMEMLAISLLSLLLLCQGGPPPQPQQCCHSQTRQLQLQLPTVWSPRTPAAAKLPLSGFVARQGCGMRITHTHQTIKLNGYMNFKLHHKV